MERGKRGMGARGEEKTGFIRAGTGVAVTTISRSGVTK
jgi:hypothetical protein